VRQFDYDEEGVKFDHVYRIWNRGQSPTNKVLHFEVYVPKSNLLHFSEVTNLCIFVSPEKKFLDRPIFLSFTDLRRKFYTRPIYM
jgi:hypothetical protein